jgi:asparagine synthase (glutamine-hydrolysing)
VLPRLNRAVPFTWPGWNSVYEAGRLTDGGLPPLVGIYPYIQDELYTSDLKKLVGDYDAFEAIHRVTRSNAHLDPVSRCQHVDHLHYLPADILTKVDRMSMAHSLEVRSPLLDPPLVEYVATLPASYKLRDGVSKYILRKVSGRMLPPGVLTKPKQGFDIPKQQWFQNELRPFAEEILLDPRSMARGYFRRDTVERLLRHHATGRRDYSPWIWCLVFLEMWCRLFLDETSTTLSARATARRSSP